MICVLRHFRLHLIVGVSILVAKCILGTDRVALTTHCVTLHRLGICCLGNLAHLAEDHVGWRSPLHVQLLRMDNLIRVYDLLNDLLRLLLIHLPNLFQSCIVRLLKALKFLLKLLKLLGLLLEVTRILQILAVELSKLL